jgi:hypothetical protein
MSLYKYQKDIVLKATQILAERHIVYLNMGMRTGKTRVALTIANNYSSVLFVTKKRVINFVYKEISELGITANITVINYEQLHKYLTEKYDLVVVDEAHSIGAFPKPSLRAKSLKTICSKNNCDVILMSGTPFPESLSQCYHQFYISNYSPFANYKNFYAFANDYVNIVLKKVSATTTVRDYSHCKDSVLAILQPYTITFSSEEGNVNTPKKEYIIYVSDDQIEKYLYQIIKLGIIRDLDYFRSNASEQFEKAWQLCGGFIYLNDKPIILSTKKAEALKSLDGYTIIFYKFIAELDILKATLGAELTTNVAEFQSGSHKYIALQYLSGREGINLSIADNIVYYNLDFSYTSYSQSIERASCQYKSNVNVYYLFYENIDFEKRILNTLKSKKNFNLKTFKMLKNSNIFVEN